MELQGRKVAVVGMGGVFPTCTKSDDFADKLFSNQSLIREWDQAKHYEKQVRSSVSGYISIEEMHLETIYSTHVEDYPEVYIDHLNRIPHAHLATADVGSIWAMLAALDAIKMAGWQEADIQSELTGVVVGSGGSGTEIARSAWRNFFELGKKSRSVGTHTVDRSMFYREAANISCLIKNKGVCEAIGSACATGLGNIGHAYRLIQYGIQDRAVAGGVEGTSLESFIGFDGMQILSRGFAPEASSRPFDIQRNGFVCSFGAGIVCLEAYDIAKARGANILGVIDRYFNNSDGDGNMFHPSYDGQKRLWKGLLGNSGMVPDVVKVHGTSTQVGDAIELFSIADTLGDKGYHIAAPKSQFGHMLGASGSVEMITALLMLKRQEVLPCLNSVQLNTELEHFQKADTWEGSQTPMAHYRELIPQETFKKEINTIVCLNYGFGGTNSSILLSRDTQ
jgi:3-oxoacyl-[acyl-carrier-protein] synthase-1